MIEALLVELEGVVVETEPLWRDALASSLREHDLTVAPELIDAGRGTPLQSRLERLARESRLPIDPTTLDLLAFGASRRFADALRRGMTMQPGARDLLENARQSARVAVVTRTRRSDVDVILTATNLDALVEFAITTEDAPTKAAAYERALTRLARRRALRRDRVLALEDSEIGADAARNAGLRCLVIEGSLPAHDLESLEEMLDARAERVG